MPITVNRRLLLAGLSALSAGSILGQGRGLAASLPRLSVESRILEVKGRAAKVFGIMNEAGGHGLNTVLSENFTATLVNNTDEETLIHWHGLTPPPKFDGVPMLSGPVQAPGEARDYDFPTRDAGTHWMHSHVGLQEQHLLAAPLIIRETATSLFDEQEHVVMLHDFTFRDPQEILAELQGGGGGHALHATMTHADGTSMAMPSPMANDITYDAMLANDRTLDDPEIVTAERGGRFRLRIINGAAASNMWIDLGQIEGEVIAVDGKSVKPLKGKRFPLAIAQRADIRLTLPGAGTWPILFRAEASTLQSAIILRSAGAAIAKISDRAEGPAAPVDLSLEKHLQSLVHRPDIAVSRSEMVMLTGGGSDYVWGLNSQSGMHQVLFNVREGERYEVMFHNMTGMAHPMHLHGHYFKVVDINGARIDGAVRDTVLVPVGETITIQFDANNPGTWAFHCHHLYHMNSGMMGAIAYADAA